MNDVAKAEKPSFLDLWMTHKFDLPTLATSAKVPLEIVQAMLNYKAVQQENAERVLSALSEVLSKECALGTVYIPIIKTPVLHNLKSQIARDMQEIDEAYTSAWYALNGPAYGASMHKFISQRIENMGWYLSQEYLNLKPEEVIALYDKFAERAQAEMQQQMENEVAP